MSIYLPTGSEPGKYEVEVVDRPDHPLVKSQGSAVLRDHIAMIEVKLNLESLRPGLYLVLCGPLVLFAITDAPPVVTARQLLAGKKAGQQSWQVETASGAISMLPFTAFADQQYSTYLIVK